MPVYIWNTTIVAAIFESSKIFWAITSGAIITLIACAMSDYSIIWWNSYGLVDKLSSIRASQLNGQGDPFIRWTLKIMVLMTSVILSFYVTLMNQYGVTFPLGSSYEYGSINISIVGFGVDQLSQSSMINGSDSLLLAIAARYVNSSLEGWGEYNTTIIYDDPKYISNKKFLVSPNITSPPELALTLFNADNPTTSSCIFGQLATANVTFSGGDYGYTRYNNTSRISTINMQSTLQCMVGQPLIIGNGSSYPNAAYSFVDGLAFKQAAIQSNAIQMGSSAISLAAYEYVNQFDNATLNIGIVYTGFRLINYGWGVGTRLGNLSIGQECQAAIAEAFSVSSYPYNVAISEIHNDGPLQTLTICELIAGSPRNLVVIHKLVINMTLTEAEQLENLQTSSINLVGLGAGNTDNQTYTYNTENLVYLNYFSMPTQGYNQTIDNYGDMLSHYEQSNGDSLLMSIGKNASAAIRSGSLVIPGTTVTVLPLIQISTGAIIICIISAALFLLTTLLNMNKVYKLYNTSIGVVVANTAKSDTRSCTSMKGTFNIDIRTMLGGKHLAVLIDGEELTTAPPDDLDKNVLITNETGLGIVQRHSNQKQAAITVTECKEILASVSTMIGTST